MTDKPVLRPAVDDDLDRIAQIHVAAFPDSAISLLGTDVARAYYDWQLHGHDDPYVVVATTRGRIVGFVVGGISSGALSGFMRHHLTDIVKAALRRPHAVVADPRVRGRLRSGLKALRHSARPGRTPKSRPAASAAVSTTSVASPSSFGILAIAVDPSVRGTGVATTLMKGAEAEARARGSASMHLSVHPDNARAVRFYEREGWTRSPEGVAWVGTMTKRLRPAEPRRQPSPMTPSSDD